MFTSKFKSIRMQEYQNFFAFYFELNDIVNSSFNLKERIPEFRIVRKILRSFPERFIPKVTTIEENKDVDFIRIDELVGSFQTYEITFLKSQKPKK